MNLSYLLQAWVPTCDRGIVVHGIQVDSRLIQKGDLFLACPGSQYDARLYIAQAFAQGAIAVVYDPDNLPESARCALNDYCFPIHDLAHQIGYIAARWYGDPAQSLHITGVTGTNGKTTIAYLLAQAHIVLGNSARYIGTLGEGEPFALHTLHNTTPDPLLLHKLLHQYRALQVQHVCMEVSSHALAQGRTHGIPFEHAIFTNLTQDHLDYHHTMAAYAEAKALLFRAPGLKTAIVNQDAQYVDDMVRHLSAACTLLYYGVTPRADVQAIDWQVHVHGTALTVRSPWGEHALWIPLPGLFNVYNGLAIFSSLCVTGYPVDAVIAAIRNLKASPGRMEIIAHEPAVIVDYAHTPDALENVLLTLKDLKKGRLMVVFGCGGDRDRGKRPMMGAVAARLADCVILTSDNPRTEDPFAIIEDIAVGCSALQAVFKIPDRQEAIAYAIKLAAADDVIVIAGKGHEAYQQIGDERVPFSDQAVVRTLLSR